MTARRRTLEYVARGHRDAMFAPVTSAIRAGGDAEAMAKDSGFGLTAGIME
jgi:hypothetical protein